MVYTRSGIRHVYVKCAGHLDDIYVFVSPVENTVGSAGEEPTIQQKLLVAASENKE
jgi:hypothetical protein